MQCPFLLLQYLHGLACSQHLMDGESIASNGRGE